MSQMRFTLVGGFLGAGKTTTIARLARAYQDRGWKVAVVTNDQAADLVDTHALRAAGFEVGEVAGACFCCSFHELAATVERLEAAQHPDIILGEPVGSCTDLVATVVQPLRRLFPHKFVVSPYGVILKPSHGLRILRNEPQSGFSPKAAYIFRKQLEEADFVMVNRIDELPAAQIAELVQLIEHERPGTPIVRMSARTGEGFGSLLELLDRSGQFGCRILDLDYDIYAEGEAELGWLNSRLRWESAAPFSLDELVLDMVGRLRSALAAIPAETAHLKIIGMHQGNHAVANLVSSDTAATLSQGSGCHTCQADVIVNARVAIDPKLLQERLQAVVQDLSRSLQARAEFHETRSFRPGRPSPTYRFAEAV